MTRSILAGAACFAALLVAAVSNAQPATPLDLNRIDPLTFRAMAARVPAGQAPRIDGSLTDAAWAVAPVTGGFYQREPDPGQPSTERTEFRVLYDDRKIYFGVWAYDSDPSGIHATEKKRDSGLTKGDRIAIVVDTFNDRRNGFNASKRYVRDIGDRLCIGAGQSFLKGVVRCIEVYKTRQEHCVNIAVKKVSYMAVRNLYRKTCF